MTLEDGEKLQASLEEVLSHQEFLTDCLTPDSFEKLKKEVSETLRAADVHRASLNRSLKVFQLLLLLSLLHMNVQWFIGIQPLITTEPSM